MASECPFATMCFKKDPLHFEEFRHPDCKYGRKHAIIRLITAFPLVVEEIILRGRNKRGEFSIPEDIMTTQDHLEMIEAVVKKRVIAKPVVMEKPIGCLTEEEHLDELLDSMGLDEFRKIMKIRFDVTKLKKEDYIPVTYPEGEAIKKYEASHPFNFFLTAIKDIPETHSEPLSITMPEILDPSFGELESSVQITFMVDYKWLLAQYYFTGN